MIRLAAIIAAGVTSTHHPIPNNWPITAYSVASRVGEAISPAQSPSGRRAYGLTCSQRLTRTISCLWYASWFNGPQGFEFTATVTLGKIVTVRVNDGHVCTIPYSAFVFPGNQHPTFPVCKP